MELLQLTYFCHAAKTENFSRTAREYRVPASNISQSVKRLEEELGAPLFDRAGNRVSLNERGAAFYREVSAALSQLRHAAERAGSRSEEKTLRLGIRVSRRVVMLAVAEFQSRFPDVGIVAEHGERTRDDDFDVIITDSVFHHPDFVRVRAFREDILLAARRDLLPGEGVPGADWLCERPFITMNANYSMHHVTRDICRELGFEPRIALQSEDPEYVRRCVDLGLGVAFAPEVSWRGQFSDGVVLCRLGDYTRQTGIYCRRGSGVPEHVDNFCRLLVECYEKEQNGG